jgi:hypothetical protein
MVDSRFGYHYGIRCVAVAYQEFLGGGGSRNSVGDRGQREGGFGGSSPLVRGSMPMKVNKTSILIRLLRMYIPRNLEFGTGFQNFGILGLV